MSSHPELLIELENELKSQGRLSSKTGAKKRKAVLFDSREDKDAKKYTSDVPKQERFEKDLVCLVAMGLLPLSFVENVWFRRLCSNLDPQIKHVSRKELTCHKMPSLNKKMKEDFLEPALSSSVGGALQFDLWMHTQTQEVFSMIFSSVDENFKMRFINLGMVAAPQTDGISLAETIKKKIAEFGLGDKVIALIKDQGANLKKATQILKIDLKTNPVSKSRLLSADCFAHAINKVLKNVYDAHPLIKTANKEVKAIVTHTKKSTKAAKSLKAAQEALNLPKKKLMSPVPTRWASYIITFDSVLQNEAAIKKAFILDATDQMKQHIPSKITWHIVRLVSVSMKRAMSVLFASQGSSFSSDILISLIELFLDFQDDLDFASDFFASLEDSLDTEDDDLLMDELVSVAESIAAALKDALVEFLLPYQEFCEDKLHIWFMLMLDPRFKKLKVLHKLRKRCPEFPIKDLYKKHYDKLIELLLNIYNNTHNLDQSNSDEEDSLSISSSDSGSDFDIHLTDSTSNNNYLIVKQEFENFRKTKECDLPGRFWSKNMHIFPNCAILARQVFSICPSQAECERSFSVAGILCANRRNRLSIENLDELLFMHKNLQNYAEFKAPALDMNFFLSREKELMELYSESLEMEVPVEECDTCLS